MEQVGKKNNKIGHRKNCPIYREKLCKVISYDPVRKTMNVTFDSHNIQLKEVDSYNSDVVIVEYSGEIGTPDFTFRLGDNNNV